MSDKYELIRFEDGEFSLDVSVDPSEDTVWLTKNRGDGREKLKHSENNQSRYIKI